MFTEGSITYTPSQVGKSGAIAISTHNSTVTAGDPAVTLGDGLTVCVASKGLGFG